MPRAHSYLASFKRSSTIKHNDNAKTGQDLENVSVSGDSCQRPGKGLDRDQIAFGDGGRQNLSEHKSLLVQVRINNILQMHQPMHTRTELSRTPPCSCTRMNRSNSLLLASLEGTI